MRTRVLIASRREALRNRATRSIYDTAPGPRYLDGLFWVEEGGASSGAGLVSGPGFKAYASDFPEGTRLTITALLELPAGGAE